MASSRTRRPDRERTPWWVLRARELDGALRRFMQRRLGPHDALDAVAAVHESLAVQFATREFAAAHPTWSGHAVPLSDQVAEFDRVLWRLARLRLLDELRRLYLRKRSVPLDDALVAGERTEARIEAREYLRRLAELVEALPADDRELLSLASDASGGPMHMTNADRVRLHRLRKMLAERLWVEWSAQK
jgi:hypothetical protein